MATPEVTPLAVEEDIRTPLENPRARRNLDEELEHADDDEEEEYEAHSSDRLSTPVKKSKTDE